MAMRRKEEERNNEELGKSTRSLNYKVNKHGTRWLALFTYIYMSGRRAKEAPSHDGPETLKERSWFYIAL